ncbi:MAG: EamA family transporter [Verrucomicrobiales bacterium]
MAILFGVAMALAPKENLHIPRRALIVGCLFGVVAAFGQGMGAVISRKAYGVAAEAHLSIDGLTAGYQRIWGGVIIATASYIILKWKRSLTSPAGREPIEPGRLKKASKFLLINAFAGPVLGVGCFQWALATTKTGIVLPIVALTPLVIIPLSSKFEGEKPSLFSLLGGVVAVAGVVALRLGMK